MPRPRRFRRVSGEPDCSYFKPRGIGLRELEEVSLNVEELEAIRLKDFENMDQINAAKKMDVSQPTFHRILVDARKKIAESLVLGKAIKIQGGNYKMPRQDGTGPEGKGPRTGRGMGECEDVESEETKDMPRGRGMGRGRGFGRRN